MAEQKKAVIGLPRGMLYHRYETLWTTFFSALGHETIFSPPSNRQILEDGSALAIDEACLSLKLYLGHVKALLGTCDYILVPRISNFGRRRTMCVRFESMYDLTRNIFRSSGQKFISYNVDVLQKQDEEHAFIDLGQSLGASGKASKKAYADAKKAQERQFRAQVKAQESLYRQEGTKILLVGHSYLVEDAYIGAPVIELLRGFGAIPLRADLTDREDALKQSVALSSTCKWELNRELLGSIQQHRAQVDGIVLMSAFPCGPDSMVNDLLLRRVHDIPMLNLVLDGQSGTAGIETRLESFIDIIHFKEGSL